MYIFLNLVYLSMSISLFLYLHTFEYLHMFLLGQSKWKQEQFTIKNVTQIFFFFLIWETNEKWKLLQSKTAMVG